MICTWKNNFHTEFKIKTVLMRHSKLQNAENLFSGGGGRAGRKGILVRKLPEGTFSNLEGLHRIPEVIRYFRQTIIQLG